SRGAGEFQISYNESSRPGVAQLKSGSPQRSAVELDAISEPVAVLPMRVSVDGRPGLVVLTKDRITPGGTAASLGGAIAINNLGVAGVTGSTQISNSTISLNHADNGTAAQGGGIYFNAKYSGTVSNCTIGSAANGNTSARGAGVFNGGGDGTT